MMQLSHADASSDASSDGRRDYGHIGPAKGRVRRMSAQGVKAGEARVYKLLAVEPDPDLSKLGCRGCGSNYHLPIVLQALKPFLRVPLFTGFKLADPHADTMRTSILLLSLGLVAGSLAQLPQCPGSWSLSPDDCICMNSQNGALLKSQTAACCKSLGYKTYNSVSLRPAPLPRCNLCCRLPGADEVHTQICAMDHDSRQDFKDCCKGLSQESVVGHCR